MQWATNVQPPCQPCSYSSGWDSRGFWPLWDKTGQEKTGNIPNSSFSPKSFRGRQGVSVKRKGSGLDVTCPLSEALLMDLLFPWKHTNGKFLTTPKLHHLFRRERRQTTKRSIVLGASTSFVHLCQLPFVASVLRLSITRKLYKIQIDKERCVLRVIYM